MIHEESRGKSISCPSSITAFGMSLSRILSTYSKPLLSSVPLRGQTSGGLRHFRQKVKRGHVGSQPLIRQENIVPVKWSVLGRPVAFTVLFSGVVFAGATIWQYENMRVEKKRKTKFPSPSLGSVWGDTRGKKVGEFRTELNRWWNNLSKADMVFAGICAANVAVFLAWRVPMLQPFMLKYFTSNPASSVVCLPMILSVFSHSSFFHLAANMYVLNGFMKPGVQILGLEQFLAVYMSAGVVSSLASMAYKVSTGRIGYSLGASGAICTVLGIFGTMFPDARMQIVFIPAFTFSASMAIKGLMAVDTAGIIMNWRFFDHAAHLGGVVFGIWWCYFGNQLIWENRLPVMQLWHDTFRKNDKPPRKN
eukprot:snap_masked-scaffold443_size169656-processed-gene-0.9 protein:Tk07434 transcript:snap_masked-scaffold443_size169656-processed-gene-0.9-mRNA-1 annotation:"presenilin rhomboid-like preproprotein"